MKPKLSKWQTFQSLPCKIFNSRHKPLALISTNCLKVSLHNKPGASSSSCQWNKEKKNKGIYRGSRASCRSNIILEFDVLSPHCHEMWPWGERHKEKQLNHVLISLFSSTQPFPANPHLARSCSISNHSLPLELNVTITSSSHRISTWKGKCQTRTWWRPEDQERVTESLVCLSTLNLPDDEGKRSNTILNHRCKIVTQRKYISTKNVSWK